MSLPFSADEMAIGTGFPNCLYFPTPDEGGPTHVDHGKIYEPSIAISNQAWIEGWARWDSGQYLVSYGAGGDHAWLFGYDINGKFTGSFWDNAAGVVFGGDEIIKPGEWHHWAVGYNNALCEVYLNGVPSGRKVSTANRYSGANNNLMVGGADHQNFYGALATIRQFEGLCPTARFAFRPDRFFEATRFATLDAYVGTATVLLADYTQPCAMIPDMGRYTGSVSHPGRLCNASVIDGVGAPLFKAPTPYWIYDAKCPVQYGRPPLSTEWGGPVLTPTAAPPTVRISDTFRRPDMTRATEANRFVGLGSTESGTQGPKTWSTSDTWGVFRGNAIWLGLSNTTRTLAWVENGVADMDVQITRRPEGGGGFAVGDVGLILRLVDANNFIRAFYYNPAYGGDGKIYLQSFVAGAFSNNYIVGTLPSSASFGTLRVKCKTVTGTTTWTVYTDGVQIVTGTGEEHVTATKAGMCYDWVTSSFSNGHGRMTNFAVLQTP